MEIQKNLDLARYTPALVTFLVNKISTGSTQIYSELFDISVTEWRIVSLLAVEHPIVAKRVSEVIGLDKATVSRSINRLEKEGYLCLSTDENDRRATFVELSEKGINLHNQVIDIALDREQEMLKPLTKDEIEQFILILNKLNQNIAAMNEASSRKYLTK
ncbi:Transcriptional regulator SlyA [Acinetobacter oleivorans]|uniref:MarR family winged helix-turn-helix transcriptional regulator n=1 Tax=Acinetobacter TaxID=469 RepID=UPI0018E000E4|nr:MarR family transcriptional regulator [Acinetobacter sp. ACIN00229]CAI3119713.1 Transcriptional regulator SlyA [Acinetobacter oleivorans]MBI0424415.1 MarR family transcriptional regulator [Acinetobacter sp. ACIN00229]CAI3119724.1 Transcriptional regulator SlyA [Acinetobacter oleivorans]CAI3119801.1 Transcriptional regulator SlyA [Acinetobacter oleivorans]CAI3119935.1 Transcriptional regulator SlyA [Acinetobacter oleivorans]